MKKNVTLLVVLGFIFCTYGQVGIGVTNPSEMLTVNGDILFTNNLNVNSIPELTSTESGFKLVTHVKNATPVAGELKKLIPSNLQVTPMRLQSYTITGVNKDNVDDINLQLSTSTYIVSISNFRWVGAKLIKKVNGVKKKKSSGLFEHRLTQSGGFWHLIIRNKYLDPINTTEGGNTVSYEVDLIIYQKKYFKELPLIARNLGGANNGAAGASQVLNFLK